MLKVADINISEDNCGLYIIKLYGNDAIYFKVIDKALYFLLEEPNICKSLYTVTISIEDLAGRFTPKTTTYTLNTYNCTCTSTTSSTTAGPTTTTTTTIPPITSTTTSTTTISPLANCYNSFLTYAQGAGVTNIVNHNTYYTGMVTGQTFGNIWGSNNYGYTDDSRWAVAVVHAGLLAPGQTGYIKFTPLGIKNNFPSTTSNGITSSTWLTNWCAVQLSNVYLFSV